METGRDAPEDEGFSDPGNDEELVDREFVERHDARGLIDDGPVDTEKDLVGDPAEGEAEEDEDLSAEELAVRIDEAPGGLTDHPDDYIQDPDMEG